MEIEMLILVSCYLIGFLVILLVGTILYKIDPNHDIETPMMIALIWPFYPTTWLIRKIMDKISDKIHKEE